jgi:ribosomal-protein-alanine N-acetyltransferase
MQGNSIYTYEDGLISLRLRTRKLELSDVGVWETFMSNPDATELFPESWKDDPPENAKLWVERQMERYTQNRYGLQALLHRETGEFIGQCGLLAQTVDGIDEVEVGYHILPKFWGNGYAPEAAKLFLNYGFNNTSVDSIISIIDIRNSKSQRVADKNGLVREQQTRWNEKDIFVYRMLRTTWEKP